MDADVLTLLMKMRDEQTAGHKELSNKIDSLGEALVAHSLSDTKALAEIDKRLTPFEDMRKTSRWAAGAGFVAFVGVLGDMLYHAFFKAP